MFCTRCGTHLADEAQYCTNCGRPTGAAPEPYLTIPPRRLQRIRDRKKIAGVCAGFADYFGMDVTLMRLIWVGLLIMPPYIGLIAYIVSWVVLPKV